MRVVLLSPAIQDVVAGELAPTAFRVRVELADGVPLPGAQVLFSVNLCTDVPLLPPSCPSIDEYGGFEVGTTPRPLSARTTTGADGVAVAPGYRAGEPAAGPIGVYLYVPPQTTADGVTISLLDALRSLDPLALTTLRFVAAVETAGRCSGEVRPAATLLVPRFEVDLDDPAGRTTLFAVGNSTDQAVLARLTVWTDWAVPTLAFDVALGPNAIQTINLRDVFQGVLPTTGGVALAGCTNPLAKPPLGAAELARLRARHTGAPDPVDGRCYARVRTDSTLVGFVTADVMNRCAPPETTPLSAGYFAPDGSGSAGYGNVLYGDFFLVDPAENLAQGNAAVHLVADLTRQGGTFYSSFGVADDGRAPLGTKHRTRYLAGGDFSGGTRLLIFAAPSFPPSPSGWVCGQDRNGGSWDTCGEHLRFTLRGEGGGPEAVVSQASDAVVVDFRVGSTDLPAATPFGSIDVEYAHYVFCISIPAGPEPLGSWVMPLHDAAGRYSVGLDSIRLEPGCS